MRRGTRLPLRAVTALLLALALLLGAVPVVAAAERGKGQARKGFERGEDFEDMGEAEWAARYVVSAQMMGLIRGYLEGGHLRFKPNQPLNRQEAVALVVRAMGLQAQAEAAGTVSGAVYELPFRDADHIQPWARGYVAVAVERGLLDAGDSMFQPMKAASRLWTVKLMVRALGLREQAEQRAGEELPFRDAAAVSAADAGYVAVAVEAGLIAGYEDRTFRPNQPVKRAEMAKLLEKLTGEIQQGELRAPEGVIRGVVAAVADGSLTVRTPDGREQAVPVAADAYVFVDDRRATLADVQPGYAVRLLLDAEGRAVLVDARSAPAAAPPGPGQPDRHPLKRKVTGTVVAVTAGADCPPAEAGGEQTACPAGQITVTDPAGQERTFQVAAWAEVKIEGYGYATLADVQPGDLVKLKLRGDVVVEVEVGGEDAADAGRAAGPAVSGKVRGVVTAVADGAVEVLLDSGETVTLRLDRRTMVWVGKRLGSLADLRVGDSVTAQAVRGVAVRVKVEGGDREKDGKGRGKGRNGRED